MEKELIEFIAKSLVDDPSRVNVEQVESDGATILELTVAESDIGKVIGKHGRTAKAMRMVLQAASAKTGRQMLLEIMDRDPAASSGNFHSRNFNSENFNSENYDSPNYSSQESGSEN